MQMSEIKGKCHAHITIEGPNVRFSCPKGWKVTIIVLNNFVQEQQDIIITRHFLIGSKKTPKISDIYEEMNRASDELTSKGRTVLRLKLEHETLPSFEPSIEHYRECHVKIKHPRNVEIATIPGFVPSRNVLEDVDAHRTVFLSARYYAGTLQNVDSTIDCAVETIKELNPNARILSVRKESIVFDSNLEMDNWWA